MSIQSDRDGEKVWVQPQRNQMQFLLYLRQILVDSEVEREKRRGGICVTQQHHSVPATTIRSIVHKLRDREEEQGQR